MNRLNASPSLTTVLVCLLVSVLGVTLLFMSCEQGSKTVSLRFKYEPGQVFKYEMTQKRTFQVTEGDSIVKQGSQEYDVEMLETVRRMVDDSTAEMVEVTTTTSIGPSKKDTTKIDTVTTTKEMVLYMQPNGKVTDVEFVSEMSESSMSYYRDFIEQGYPVFPSGEVAQGYSWTQTTRVLLNDEPTEASTTYEIKSFARERGYDCVVIAYEGNIIIPVSWHDKDGSSSEGVNRIQITGMTYFAYKEGMTVSNRDRWTVEGDRVQKKADGEPRELKIFYEGDSNMVLKSVEIMAGS